MVGGSYANAKSRLCPRKHSYEYVNIFLCFSCRVRSWNTRLRYTPLKKCS